MGILRTSDNLGTYRDQEHILDGVWHTDKNAITLLSLPA